MRNRVSGRPADPDNPRLTPKHPSSESRIDPAPDEPDAFASGDTAQLVAMHSADERVKWHRKDEPQFRPETPLPPAFMIPGRQDILTYVDSRVRAPETRLVVLQGRRRLGKTTLLRALEQQLSESCQPMYFDLHGWEAQPLGTFLSELAESVHRLAGNVPPRWQKREDPGQARLQLHAALKKLNPERPLVLLLDELSAWLPSSGSDLTGRRIYRYIQELTLQEPSFRAVLALGRHPGLPELSSPLQVLERAPSRQLLPLSESAASEVLSPLRQAGPGLEDAALRWILQQSGCQPWLLQLLGAEAWQHLSTRQGQPLTALELSAHQARVLRTGKEGLDWMWEGFSGSEQDVLSAISMGLPIDRPIGRHEVEQRLIQFDRQEALSTLDAVIVRLEAEGVLIEQREGGAHVGLTLQAELLRAYVGTFHPLRAVERVLERSSLRQSVTPDAPRLRPATLSPRPTLRSSADQSLEPPLRERSLGLETAIPAHAPLFSELESTEDAAWHAPVELARAPSESSASTEMREAQGSAPLGVSARESWFAQASQPQEPALQLAPVPAEVQGEEAFSPSLPLPLVASTERPEPPSSARTTLPRASGVALRPRLPLGGAEVVLPSLKPTPAPNANRGPSPPELRPPPWERTASFAPTQALEPPRADVLAFQPGLQEGSSEGPGLEQAPPRPEPELLQPTPQEPAAAATDATLRDGPTASAVPALDEQGARVPTTAVEDTPAISRVIAQPDPPSRASAAGIAAEASQAPERAARTNTAETSAPLPVVHPAGVTRGTPSSGPAESTPGVPPAGPLPPVTAPRRAPFPPHDEPLLPPLAVGLDAVADRTARYSRALALWEDGQLDDAQLLLVGVVAEQRTFRGKEGFLALELLDQVTALKLGYVTPAAEQSGLSRGRTKMLSLGSFVAGVLLSIGAMQVIQPQSVQESPATLALAEVEQTEAGAQRQERSEPRPLGTEAAVAPVPTPRADAGTGSPPPSPSPFSKRTGAVPNTVSSASPPVAALLPVAPTPRAARAGEAVQPARVEVPPGSVRSPLPVPTPEANAPTEKTSVAAPLPAVLPPAGKIAEPLAKSPPKQSPAGPTDPKLKTSAAAPPGLKTAPTLSSTTLLAPSDASGPTADKASNLPKRMASEAARLSGQPPAPPSGSLPQAASPERAKPAKTDLLAGQQGPLDSGRTRTAATVSPAASKPAPAAAQGPTGTKAGPGGATPEAIKGLEKGPNAPTAVRQSGDRLRALAPEKPLGQVKPAGTDADPFGAPSTARAKKEPRDAYERALVAIEASRLDDAFSLLREAVRETPERAEVWAELGQVHERLGRPDDALRAWSKAVQLDPTLPRAWYGVGKLLQARGRKTEAIQAFQQVVALAPAGTLSRDASRRLSQLDQEGAPAGIWGPGSAPAAPVKVFQGEDKKR